MRTAFKYQHGVGTLETGNMIRFIQLSTYNKHTLYLVNNNFSNHYRFDV